MMLPMQTALVPINIIYSKLDLLNTYFGLFYVYIAFGLSYAILVMRGFMRGIRTILIGLHILTAVTVGVCFGVSSYQLRNLRSATLIITDFLATWNEYLLASVIINDSAKKTVPVGLMTFIGEHAIDYGYLCAGVFISVVPVILVYLIFQRYFVEDGWSSKRLA